MAIAPKQPKFLYDPRTGKYYRESGQALADPIIAGVIADLITRATGNADAAISLLIKGQITLVSWTINLANELKKLYINIYALTVGGIDNLSALDYALIALMLNNEFSRLRQFGLDLTGGSITENQARARLSRYSENAVAAKNMAEREQRSRNGFVLAQRFTDPTVKNCPSCLRYEAMGAVPIDEIPVLGQNCECGKHCHCTIVFYRSLAEQVEYLNNRNNP